MPLPPHCVRVQDAGAVLAGPSPSTGSGFVEGGGIVMEKVSEVDTVVAAVVMVPIALVAEGGLAAPSGESWVLVAVMAVLPGTGHLLTNFAHGHVSLTQMSLISLLFTAVAPLYAWWLVGERVVGQQAVGMVVVMTALAFVVTRPVEVVGR